MASFISPERSREISAVLFNNFSVHSREQFLRKQLERYVPEMNRWSAQEIADFAHYHRALYLDGAIPEIGKPIGSPNPRFIDTIDEVRFRIEGVPTYVRASTKENGYRMQLHIGPQKSAYPQASAYTRQFTPYDLRMFPELHEALAQLPVMIGDAELISAVHPNFAGFERVNWRIPNAHYWPDRQTRQVAAEFLAAYLANPKRFQGGMPLPDTELTLAFHGMFAIAHPDTWERDRGAQFAALESLCVLPFDYRNIDERLDQLQEFIARRGLKVRVVNRERIHTRRALEELVDAHEQQKLEGVCVVQSHPAECLPSFKLKNYETVDMVALGLYLADPAQGIVPNNLTGMLLGVYDPVVGTYLAAIKVNLDPNGVQIKTEGQRARLESLRPQIADAAVPLGEGSLFTLWDAYCSSGAYKFDRLGVRSEFTELMGRLPRGNTFLRLFDEYLEQQPLYDRGAKPKTKAGECVATYRPVFSALAQLATHDPQTYRKHRKYFAAERNVREKSKQLPQPDVLLDPESPLLVEAKVFRVKWGPNAFPAGFHSWYADSFKMENAFPEVIRHDKATTTDYETLYTMARRNMGRTRQRNRGVMHG